MPSAFQSCRASNGHPVADNPLRLLFGGVSEGYSLKELERNAKALRLQARHGPITPEEPLQHLCPRQRCEEDYAAAQKKVNSPVQLATALFFWPSTFGVDNPMLQANKRLLEAEGLPQGSGRKAELLQQAVVDYDSLAAEKWRAFAVATAGKLLGVEPDDHDVRHAIGEAVRQVIEGVVADFGDTIEASEIDLLNAIDDCVRLPEIRNAGHAADDVIEKQLKRVDDYLEVAYATFKTQGWQATPLSASEIRALVQKCQEAKDAFTLLQRRPSLLRKMPADRLVHLSTVSIALAYRIGNELSEWDEASRLSTGVEPRHIDPSLDSDFQRFLKIACRAVPLLCHAANGRDVEAALDSLRAEFPDGAKTIENFKQQARALRGGSMGTNSDTARRVAKKQPTLLYVVLDGKSHGPLSLEQVLDMVRQGQLTGETLAWKEGIGDWKRLDQLMSLPSAQTGQSTKNPVSPAAMPPVPNLAAKPQGRGNVGCLAVLGIVIVLVLISNCSGSKTTSNAPAPDTQSYRVPRSAAAPLRAEKDAIEQERIRVNRLFDRADQLKRELDTDQILLDRGNTFAVSRYNQKVNEANGLLEAARREQALLNARVAAYNSSLRNQAR